MNILYYLDVFPKVSESFILNEVYELEKKGHNVAVCSLKEPDSDINHEEYTELNASIRHIEDPTYTDILEGFSPNLLKSIAGPELLYRATPKHHAANLIRAKRSIQFIESIDWDIDHVHSHFANVSKFGGKHIATYYDVPFTITTHAYDIYRKPIGKYTKKLLNIADRVITISEYNKRYLKDEMGVETAVDIVRAGIKPEKFSPSKSVRKNRVLTVGRFVEKKGHPYALDAIAKATEVLPNIEYHIIGAGEQIGPLKRKTEELGLTENVSFLSNVSDERLLNEFDQARCFLLPCVVADSGDRDGIPVVLMESMAMQTPPISTAISGIPELIDDGENGVLVEPRHSESIGKAVIQLLENDSIYSKYSKNSREKVTEEFNIDREAEKLENIFTNS
ncbi:MULTISPECIES: glycosyltransferase [unclassified Natrinema]|uniref:glycosyltransferase n=1 Tax=unclassified Natrinema TaxID=2622230 RepID=UPI00026D4741|nr:MULTISPECIES: glycosyltransferase [unclassified Natrinema]AFO56972.1 hexosyltransferase/glycosyltransferase [Natrinema sp. J7-2]